MPHMLARCAACVAAAMAQGRARAGIISLAKCPRLAFTARVRSDTRDEEFHTLGLVPNACQPRNWRRKPRRVSPLSGVFLCPDTQRKTGRLRAELRYGSTQGTPNLPAQQKTENEQRRQVRRCGFLSSFLALFRAVAVQLFGGAFAFPILSLLSFGYPLPLTSPYAT